MSAFAGSSADAVAGAFHIVESKKLKRFVLAQRLSGDMHASSSGGRICHHDFTCALRRSAIDPRELNSSDEESESRDSIADMIRESTKLGTY